jgi:hemolysin III
MTGSSSRFAYSFGEEVANSVTHGLGAALAVAGMAVLVTFAARHGNAWHVVGSSVFGATLVVMYVVSTLYHGLPLPRVKRVLRILDHSAIFLLIAGTYTPFALVSLRGPWGWSLLGVIWSVAVAGIALRLRSAGRRRAVPAVALYVIMGWAAVAAAGPLIDSVAPGGLLLLVAGGLAYTGGLVFYAWRRLPYNHAIWHVFVLAGSVAHYLAVLFFVIPGGGQA